MVAEGRPTIEEEPPVPAEEEEEEKPEEEPKKKEDEDDDDDDEGENKGKNKGEKNAKERLEQKILENIELLKEAEERERNPQKPEEEKGWNSWDDNPITRNKVFNYLVDSELMFGVIPLKQLTATIATLMSRLFEAAKKVWAKKGNVGFWEIHDIVKNGKGKRGGNK